MSKCDKCGETKTDPTVNTMMLVSWSILFFVFGVVVTYGGLFDMLIPLPSEVVRIGVIRVCAILAGASIVFIILGALIQSYENRVIE